MAHAPGRNDPCPCGSGRKYKHCCLDAQNDVERQWRSVREAEGRTVPELLHHAIESVGKAGMRAAWKSFCGDSVPFEMATEDPDFDQLFVTWLLFDWRKPQAKVRYSTRNWPERPIAAAFLEERGAGLSPLDERFIRTALASPFSFFAVESVEPGRSIGLRNVLTGERRTVLERSASQTVEAGTLLFTKVLDVDTVSIMLGAGHWSIPPAFHNHIIDLRQRWAAGGSVLEPQAVKARHVELLDYYGTIVEELMDPTPPRLQNTDGDPLAPTTLEFELRCSQVEAVERLAVLAHGLGVADILESAERKKGGTLVYEVPWLVPGNRMHSDWDNTSLGTITVAATRVEAEVNSERRAKRLRKEMERRLGDRVQFLRQETQSIEALLSRPKGRKQRAADLESDAFQSRPEVRAKLKEMMDRHWEAWMEQPIPALGGETPRVAATTALGRERLEALLNDFEFKDRSHPPDERTDIGRLRRALGLA